jgi:ribosomal protein L40E
VKTIKFFVTLIIFFGTIALMGFVGFMIGVMVSPHHTFDVLVDAIRGAMIGLLVGIPIAIYTANYSEKHFWSRGKSEDSLLTDNYRIQNEWEKESRQPELEKLRVEKYGSKIIVCLSCGTKNSTSFSRCLKCSKDLDREKPVDNPYVI